jgi:hypothetical protein
VEGSASSHLLGFNEESLYVLSISSSSIPRNSIDFPLAITPLDRFEPQPTNHLTVARRKIKGYSGELSSRVRRFFKKTPVGCGNDRRSLIVDSCITCIVNTYPFAEDVDGFVGKSGVTGVSP